MRAILVYGPDIGLVRERADALARSVVTDLGDPFRIAELTGEALRDDPARLHDEVASIAFGGGRRVVRVRGAVDGNTQYFAALLERFPGDSLVVAEAGDLGKKSTLRLMFEVANNAASLPCYVDEGEALERIIETGLRAHGLSAAPDAVEWLAANLGADRLATRAELEKLALYMGEEKRVELAHARACIGDGAAVSLDDVIFSVGAGDADALERLLGRLWLEGIEPIAVLRAAERHFMRLHLAAGLMERGRGVTEAMAALRPPVFFKLADNFRAQLRRWPLTRLSAAIARLTEAEIQCKTAASSIAASFTGQTLLALCKGGTGGRA